MWKQSLQGMSCYLGGSLHLDDFLTTFDISLSWP